MYLIICNSNCERSECMLLAATADRMRLAVPGCVDAVELTRKQGQWVLEGQEPVELESLLAASAPGRIYSAEGLPKAS
jgi:hypothetical protein